VAVRRMRVASRKRQGRPMTSVGESTLMPLLSPFPI
jgi:hypothetical protein